MYKKQDNSDLSHRGHRVHREKTVCIRAEELINMQVTPELKEYPVPSVISVSSVEKNNG